MALTGYPKSYDHPSVEVLEEGGELTGGNYMLIKSFGENSQDWIHYKVQYPNSKTPSTKHDIFVTVGTVLHGPFSYVKHHDEGATLGVSGSEQPCWTLVYEVED